MSTEVLLDQLGFEYIDDTAAHTGAFCRLYALSAATISAATAALVRSPVACHAAPSSSTSSACTAATAAAASSRIEAQESATALNASAARSGGGAEEELGSEEAAGGRSDCGIDCESAAAAAGASAPVRR